ncbi:MAG TPA: hypothetical protein VMZ92_05855, partial [Planctomycetota bacterium]|nr:hypothetical protein [Planctomycetota bacterium]
HYPEIIREIKLALQECGRKMGAFINRRRREADERTKRDYITTYMPAIAEALTDILKLKDGQTRVVVSRLREVLERTRRVKVAGERILTPGGRGRTPGDAEATRPAKKTTKPAKKATEQAAKATRKRQKTTVSAGKPAGKRASERAGKRPRKGKTKVRK